MDIATAITALGSALDLLKAGVHARDQAKIADATQTLQRRIIEIQSACIELQQHQLASMQAAQAYEHERRELRERIAELERRAGDRAAHKLVELAPGALAYAPAEANEPAASTYRYCQPCMDNRAQKSVLQTVPGDRSKVFCPECKAQLQITQTPDFTGTRRGSPMTG